MTQEQCNIIKRCASVGELFVDVYASTVVNALQAMERLTWKPIETAPKDGTIILVSSPSYGVCAVEWDSITEHFPDAEPEYGFYFPYSEQDECGGGVMVEDATHWMYLPEKVI